MFPRLRRHRFALHTLALSLLLGSALGLALAAEHRTLTEILLGLAVLGATLALGV